MNKEQALQTIEQALNVANMKGAFSLAEAQAVIQALLVLKPEQSSDVKKVIENG